MKNTVMISLLLLLGSSGWGQSNISTGLLPSVKVTYSLSERFRAVVGMETRNVLIDQWEEPDVVYTWRLIDLSGIVSYRTSANTSLNTGYVARLVEGKILNRFLQQFNVVLDRSALRIGHRFATDQTVGQDYPFEFRTRYRITLEKPLQGDRADPKEWYLKVGNEYLWSVQEDMSDIEVRLSPVLGYIINPKNRVEFGIDYRFNEFLLSPSDHDFWIVLSWYGAFGR